jgi:prepilin-type N-terminal cleavage/methylation domain-containing protein
MRKGFTILELLVASLLLGMLVTILTMIFNQSSIAWRTGTANVADLDDVRDNMAEIREEADNAFAWGGEVRRITGLWQANGDLHDRACDAKGSTAYSEKNGRWRANYIRNTSGDMLAGPKPALYSEQLNVVMAGGEDGIANIKTYFVNVMSAGPNRQFDDWDDVWSAPDDFQ